MVGVWAMMPVRNATMGGITDFDAVLDRGTRREMGLGSFI
jgi:hypothetical protein